MSGAGNDGVRFPRNRFEVVSYFNALNHPLRTDRPLGLIRKKQFWNPIWKKMKSTICLIIFHTAVFGKHFLAEMENGTLSEHKSEENDYAMSPGRRLRRGNRPCRFSGLLFTSRKVTKGTNKFGQMVLQDLEKSTNLVFSPFSLSTALAMLAPGARGNTQKQVLLPW